MALLRLTASGFRNLEMADATFDSGLNLVLGANGQGKTNLLEAIAVLGNLRSFRQAGPRKLAQFGQRSFRLDGVIQTRGEELRLTQVVELGPPLRRHLQINGARAAIESYLLQFPIFSLSSKEGLLVTGAPEGRRALVDRLAFFIDRGHFDGLRRYRSCLRQRNAAVLTGRSGSGLSLWEDRLAETAAEVVGRRRRAVSSWQPFFYEVYEALRTQTFPDLSMAYRCESDLGASKDSEVAEFYRQRYHDSRARDRKAGFTVDGPHRHDLQLRVGGRSARDVLSAGQVKTVAAALCFSTLALVEERRKESLPILVDDVDAEIDDDVLERLITVLGRRRQMFMSSAHEKSLIGVVREAARWFMVDGSLQSGQRPSEVDNG